MNEDKLMIITRIKKSYEYINKNLENFPHKYINLKNNIENTLFEMLELCYRANYNLEKNNNQLMCLAKLSMLDYYLKLSYKEEIISKKKFESIAKHLREIQAMIIKWKDIDETSI